MSSQLHGNCVQIENLSVPEAALTLVYSEGWPFLLGTGLLWFFLWHGLFLVSFVHPAHPACPSPRGMIFSAETRPCWQLHAVQGNGPEEQMKEIMCESQHVICVLPICKAEELSKTDFHVRESICKSDPVQLTLRLSRLEGLVLHPQLSQSFPHPRPH